MKRTVEKVKVLSLLDSIWDGDVEVERALISVLTDISVGLQEGVSRF